MALEASRRGLDTFNEKGTQSHRTEVHSIASGLWHDFTTITDYHKTGAFDPPLAEDVHSLLEQVHEAVGGRHNLIYEEGIHWPRAKMISDLFATIALDGLRARSSSLH